MFCPRCAAENAENAQFCRACGANISLVPQAVSGKLAERAGEPEGGSGKGRRDHARRNEEVSIERAVRSLFMGLAFFFIAFAVRVWAPGGSVWWFWMFLPAAGLLADAVSTYLRLRVRERRGNSPTLPYAPSAPSFAAPAQAARLPERETGELIQPPSVTEATTRHLATPAKQREDV